MTSYSTLTILLILVAALSTPAAAVNRKLQRRKGRKLSSSDKNSKCTKVAKDSCIHIVMDDLEAKNRNNKNNVDTAMRLNDQNNFKRQVIGTTWLSSGKIRGPNGRFNNDDYFYHITCDVVKVSGSSGDLFIAVEKAICHLDICIGSTYTYDDIEIPDCVYLKGFITGKNEGVATLERDDPYRLQNVDDFTAMIVAGTGRFTGSIGYAYVQPNSDFDSDSDGPGTWEIDLDTSASNWFESEKQSARSSEFSAVFDTTVVP